MPHCSKLAGATRPAGFLVNPQQWLHKSSPVSHGSSTAAAAAAALLLLHTSPAAVALEATVDHSWQPCPNGKQCVSTNSFMQPAQYLPPWIYQPDTQQTALR